jgi:hypothetical protein
MTKPLSPAAQAVLDATYEEMDYALPRRVRWTAAAVLRALAVRINGADAIRQDILDIATELESQP